MVQLPVLCSTIFRCHKVWNSYSALIIPHILNRSWNGPWLKQSECWCLTWMNQCWKYLLKASTMEQSYNPVNAHAFMFIIVHHVVVILKILHMEHILPFKRRSNIFSCRCGLILNLCRWMKSVAESIQCIIMNLLYSWFWTFCGIKINDLGESGFPGFLRNLVNDLWQLILPQGW